MAQYAYRIEHNYGTGNEERWDPYLDGVGVESHKGPIQEYAQLALDNHLDELDEDTAYGQWRVLVYNTKYNVHGENRIDIADPDDADAIADAVTRFQRAGKLPRGGFTHRRVRSGDYWVHQEHPWVYTTTICVVQ